MKLDELVQTSIDVAATSGRLDKISKLAALLSRVTPEDAPIAIGFLIGWPRQGKLGVGWSSASAARDADAASAPALFAVDDDLCGVFVDHPYRMRGFAPTE